MESESWSRGLIDGAGDITRRGSSRFSSFHSPLAVDATSAPVLPLLYFVAIGLGIHHRRDYVHSALRFISGPSYLRAHRRGFSAAALERHGQHVFETMAARFGKIVAAIVHDCLSIAFLCWHSSPNVGSPRGITIRGQAFSERGFVGSVGIHNGNAFPNRFADAGQLSKHASNDKSKRCNSRACRMGVGLECRRQCPWLRHRDSGGDSIRTEYYVDVRGGGLFFGFTAYPDPTTVLRWEGGRRSGMISQFLVCVGP